MNLKLTTEWAVGILEGEGCFSIHKRSNRPNTVSCAIHCEMTDQDTIENLARVLQCGTICTREGRRGHKKSWIWSVQKQKDIFDLLITIMPLLSKRRLEKAQELFTYLEPKVVN
jgi:hypothetical protein